MHIQLPELPSYLSHVARIGGSASLHAVTQMLQTVSLGFTHMAVIPGLPVSGRVLLREYNGAHADIAALPKIYSALEMAYELMGLKGDGGEARYDPPEQPDNADWIKGWEIYKAEVEGTPVILALAKWLT